MALSQCNMHIHDVAEVWAQIFWLALRPTAWPWSSLALVCRAWRDLCISRQRRLWFTEHSTL